jgi:hypothetical protein
MSQDDLFAVALSDSSSSSGEEAKKENAPEFFTPDLFG